LISGHIGRETPGLISNPEVKPATIKFALGFYLERLVVANHLKLFFKKRFIKMQLRKNLLRKGLSKRSFAKTF